MSEIVSEKIWIKFYGDEPDLVQLLQCHLPEGEQRKFILTGIKGELKLPKLQKLYLMDYEKV